MVLPRMVLRSAAACSTPFFICAPVAALGPVIGPPTPNLTWADAVPAVAIAMLNTRPNVLIFFIGGFPCNWSRHTAFGDLMSGQFSAPAHQAGWLVEPAI